MTIIKGDLFLILQYLFPKVHNFSTSTIRLDQNKRPSYNKSEQDKSRKKLMSHKILLH